MFSASAFYNLAVRNMWTCCHIATHHFVSKLSLCFCCATDGCDGWSLPLWHTVCSCVRSAASSHSQTKWKWVYVGVGARLQQYICVENIVLVLYMFAPSWPSSSRLVLQMLLEPKDVPCSVHSSLTDFLLVYCPFPPLCHFLCALLYCTLYAHTLNPKP